MKRILLLTSGGDSPGMNATIRSIVRAGYYNKLTVYACHNGFQGLVDKDIFKIDKHDVTGIIQRGGTIIRSSRCKSFHLKKQRDKVRHFLKEQKIDGLVVIGGDGSFRGASLLDQEGGPNVIGIPGTIDNDVLGTEYTIGFDTARNTALRAIDNIRDTAFSNNRYFLVEVMGQRAGFLAVDVGLAGGAEYILTPEFPITTKELVSQIMAPRRKKESLIMVVAEAGKAGRSIKLAEQLKKQTPFEYRVCILGHIQRGGSPTVMDRDIGTRMGYLAVEALLQGISSQMTAIQNGKLVLTPFRGSEAGYRKLADPELLEIGAALAK